MLWIGILTAALSGILMSVQGVCNTGVSKQTGLWTTGVYVSLAAALVCLILRAVTDGNQRFTALFDVQPRYLLFGGIFGAFITGTVVYSIGKLGTARAELVIVVSQLIAAYGISLLGWFGSEQEAFSWRRLLALAVSLAGVVWYNF